MLGDGERYTTGYNPDSDQSYMRFECGYFYQWAFDATYNSVIEDKIIRSHRESHTTLTPIMQES